MTSEKTLRLKELAFWAVRMFDTTIIGRGTAKKHLLPSSVEHRQSVAEVAHLQAFLVDVFQLW
jgi:hypothetical protein